MSPDLLTSNNYFSNTFDSNLMSMGTHQRAQNYTSYVSPSASNRDLKSNNKSKYSSEISLKMREKYQISKPPISPTLNIPFSTTNENEDIESQFEL